MRGRRLVLAILMALLLLVVFAGCDRTPQNENLHTLTFMTDGGSFIPAITAETGTPITPPADPVKNGSFFAGWFLDADRMGEEVDIPTVMPDHDMAFFAKWTQGSPLTLDTDGGYLEQTEFMVAQGRNLTAFLKDMIPLRNGLEFAGWYLDGEPLSEDAVMPGDAVVLKAHYNATYSLTVMLQDLESETYSPSQELSKSGKAELGTVISLSFAEVEGFTYERGGSVSGSSVRLVVSAALADNSVSVYFTRNEYTLTFKDGTGEQEGHSQTMRYPYGKEISVPESEFELDGKRFAGWRSGSDVCFAGSSYTVLGDREFVAAWDAQYLDRSGGADVLFVLALETGRVELDRGVLEPLKGDINSDGIFTLVAESGAEYIGKINEDEGLFSWQRGGALSFVRYDASSGIAEGDTIALDPYFGFTRRISVGGNQVYYGVYFFDNAHGDYVFRYEAYESGDPVIVQEHFELGMEEGRDVFYLKGERDNVYFAVLGGKYLELRIDEASDGASVTVMAGSGWRDVSVAAQGTLSSEGNHYVLNVTSLQDPSLDLVLRDMRFVLEGGSFRTIDGKQGVYSLDDGGELTLDGFSNATLSQNSEQTVGNYVPTEDGVIAHFPSGGNRYVLSEGSATLAETKIGKTYACNDYTQLTIDAYFTALYIDRRGVEHVVTYSEEREQERDLVRFTLNGEEYTFMLLDDKALKIGNEAGVYSHGAERLTLDGLGGAEYSSSDGILEGTYSFNADTEDYTFSPDNGDEPFRFRASADSFAKHDPKISGTFENKFAENSVLMLDGYGGAALEEGNIRTSGSLEFDEEDVYVLSLGLSSVRCKLYDGVFVLFDNLRNGNFLKYDPSDGTLTEEVLVMDGFDGVSISSRELVGTIISYNPETLIFRAETADGEFSYQCFEFPSEQESVPAFGEFDQSRVLTYSDGAGTLTLNGYGRAEFVPSLEEEEPALKGFYYNWQNILVFLSDDGEHYYFNVDGEAYTLATEFVIDGNELLLYVGEGGHVEIPSSVSIIKRAAFKGKDTLLSVRADAVSTIEEEAFYGCAQLASATLSSVSEIRSKAFYGCDAISELAFTRLQIIGESAFEGLNATITTSEIKEIGNRAFAHADGSALVLRWTGRNFTLPSVSGDPFAFDGEGEDNFAILLEGIDVLKLFNVGNVWKPYIKYLALASTSPIGEMVDIAELERVNFGRNFHEDNLYWTYFISDEKATYRALYDNANGYLERQGIVTREDGNIVKITMQDNASPHAYAAIGQTVTYSSDEHTLSLTLGLDETLSATFDASPVTFEREGKRFSVGNHTYFVTLSANETFTYRTEYSNTFGTFSDRGSEGSNVTLDYTNEDGTEFALSGNWIQNSRGVGGDRFDLTDPSVSSVFQSREGNTFTFYIYAFDNLNIVDITIDESARTYSAQTRSVYYGSRENLGFSSSLSGEVVIYRAAQSETSTVMYISLEITNRQGDVLYRVYDTDFKAADGGGYTITIPVRDDIPVNDQGNYSLTKESGGWNLQKIRN